MAMEDESLAGVEAAPQGLVLNELAANETSLLHWQKPFFHRALYLIWR